MSAVCACGNQDLEYKSGISKKTGKKWQGWKCAPCDLMMGMDGIPWGDKGSKPKATQNAPQVGKTAYSRPPVNPISTLEAKVDKILAILRAEFPSALSVEGTTVEDNDSTPF